MYARSQEQIVQATDPAQAKEILSAIAQKAKDLAPKVREITQMYEQLRPRSKELAQRIQQALNGNQLPKACSFTGG